MNVHTKSALVLAGLALVFFLWVKQADAVYNANTAGAVSDVIVYADTDAIYFRLSNQPTSHAGCNSTFFVIPSALTAERRKAMLARLMLAKGVGETVTIGYDDTGDCADGYIRAHRVG